MHRISAVFDEIEPVVIVNEGTLQTALPVFIRQRPVSRKRRWLIPVWAKIREDQPAQFAHRIREMLYLLGKLAFLWLCRHFQALPLNVEKPAVIRAADAAVFDLAVFQRGSAMGTVKTQKTDLPIRIPKQHQLFSQHFHGLRNVVETA